MVICLVIGRELVTCSDCELVIGRELVTWSDYKMVIGIFCLLSSVLISLIRMFSRVLGPYIIRVRNKSSGEFTPDRKT